MSAHGAEHGGHGAVHEHKADHGKDSHAAHGHGDHGHEKKEGFWKMFTGRLRKVFNIGALLALSHLAVDVAAKPIAFETAKGAMTTPATITAEAASKVKAGHGGGSHGGHGGGDHSHGGGQH